jgi:hypothetical protein
MSPKVFGEKVEDKVVTGREEEGSDVLAGPAGNTEPGGPAQN